MIPTPSKLILTTGAVLLTGVAAIAESPVKRIDHPNGGPTFAANPRAKSPTVAIYVNEQGIAAERSSTAERRESRTSKVNTGRGQSIEVRKSR